MSRNNQQELCANLTRNAHDDVQEFLIIYPDVQFIVARQDFARQASGWENYSCVHGGKTGDGEKH